jgi:adhesin transport system membrane fusion protein
LSETVRGGENRVERTDIRSPVDGVVNSLAINTIGSFVQPGSLIAEVVPTSDELLVEARISPRDVAFVRVGQPALVKVSAYDFSIYGGLGAKVATVTADSVVDQQTGEVFFQVLVRTTKAYLEHRGQQHKITPGMISTVDIITGRKTILHYLLKPINKARQEALTER